MHKLQRFLNLFVTYKLMLRNAVRCKPQGACRQREHLRRKTGQARQFINLPIAISPITSAFTLRRCAVA